MPFATAQRSILARFGVGALASVRSVGISPPRALKRASDSSHTNVCSMPFHTKKPPAEARGLDQQRACRGLLAGGHGRLARVACAPWRSAVRAGFVAHLFATTAVANRS